MSIGKTLKYEKNIIIVIYSFNLKEIIDILAYSERGKSSINNNQLAGKLETNICILSFIQLYSLAAK